MEATSKLITLTFICGDPLFLSTDTGLFYDIYLFQEFNGLFLTIMIQNTKTFTVASRRRWSKATSTYKKLFSTRPK